MSVYDGLADRYDEHFSRPVDRWEDQHLTRLIRPHAAGRSVLDLACGTGWVADTCDPGKYTGIDASGAMLARCHAKHPDALLLTRQTIGCPGWTGLLTPGYDVVVCTWAAHYLDDLAAVLHDLAPYLAPRAAVILHGCGPRYARRPHYIADGTGHLRFTPEMVSRASERAGWPYPGVTGCGALPDWAAGLLGPRLGAAAWAAALAAGPAWHYSVAYTWTAP